ncbi:ATP-binding protein [Streptomyces sp. SCSIO 30461]|uniref:ATP-binding protein n=1 Tax=Streptomyces sp. SCSIO 30461 TaxID=3118085 RepID=UPI0030D004B3
MSIQRDPSEDTDGLSERDAAWPGRLRQLIRGRLIQWAQPDVIETVQLLLTELATNALRHGQGQDIDVRVLFCGGQCVIEVADGTPDPAELRDVTPDDEHGRGLFLVDAIADAWGTSPDGTTTWCSLSLS